MTVTVDASTAGELTVTWPAQGGATHHWIRWRDSGAWQPWREVAASGLVQTVTAGTTRTYQVEAASPFGVIATGQGSGAAT